MVLLNVHQLEKSFGARTLFRDLRFGIESGEKVGLVGPNGVGKSTLLKILSGAVNPDEGEVTRAKGLRFGFLDQDPQFIEGQSILDAILEKVHDADDSLADAYTFISLLELDQFGESFSVDQLSGGWKKRVALARELILEPQLLLLDEPTNHLDVEGILWLEKFLAQQSFATLIITHDRLFLQRVCDRILDLDPRNPNFLLDVKGNYVAYAEAKELILASEKRREDVMKNKLRREKEWLSRGPQARQTKQKARVQEAHELIDDTAEVISRNASRSADIDFGTASRLPKKLILAENLSKKYGDRVLFEDLNLLIRPTTRLGLLGENGSGKSTLIKCLLGMENPTAGNLEQAENLKVSYFEQSKETIDLDKTVLKNVCPEGDYVSFRGQFVHNRSYLEKFLFFSHHVDLPARKLSGGEKARLRLAQLMLQDAQVLVLDEPTNDLDSDTLDVLEEALANFHGAVILVTHDRYFMDSVCDSLLAFPKPHTHDRTLHTFADYFQWEEWYLGQLKGKNSKASPASAAPQPATPAPEPKKAVKLSFKDKFEFENMEKEISKLEADLQAAEMQNDYAKMAEIQDQLNKKFERWAQLEEMIKS